MAIITSTINSIASSLTLTQSNGPLMPHLKIRIKSNSPEYEYISKIKLTSVVEDDQMASLSIDTSLVTTHFRGLLFFTFYTCLLYFLYVPYNTFYTCLLYFLYVPYNDKEVSSSFFFEFFFKCLDLILKSYLLIHWQALYPLDKCAVI